MITCSVCKTENHHLNIICSSCGGFIQTKIENLDLFSILGKLIDNPKKAFLIISVARHKNYSVFLSLLFGIAFLNMIYESIHIGDLLNEDGSILLLLVLIGPLVGISLLSLYSITLLVVARLLVAPVKFRNIFAVCSYSTIPFSIFFILFFPIKLLTFGISHYGIYPPAQIINPIVYYISFYLEFIFFLWFLFLSTTGIKTLYDLKIVKAILLNGIQLTLWITSIYILINYFRTL